MAPNYKYSKFLLEITQIVKCNSCSTNPLRLYQCSNGHPYCPACAEMHKDCITCKGGIIFSNCTTLNKLLESLQCSNEEEAIEQIITQLECSICYKRIDPPVKVCLFGHVVCVSCYRRIACCPVCSSSFSKKQNKLLNKFISKFPYPCKYQNMGCKVINNYKELLHHEPDCMYREFMCHVKKCNWSSTKEHLAQHVNERHIDVLRTSSYDKVELKFITTPEENTEAAWETVNLVIFNRKLFWQHFRIVNKRVLCVVILVGSTKEANEYKAVVEGISWSQTLDVLGEDVNVEELFNIHFPQANDITNMLKTVKINTEPEILLIAECKISLHHYLSGRLNILELFSLTLIGGLVLYFCINRGLL